MKRAVVFAHYDKDLIIDDYVIYYLKELKKVAETVIFVSCKNLPDNEKLKLDGIVNHIIDEEHNEYDFGSYKRGFLYLEPKLEDFDEVIFANDSCYGPLFPLKNVFEKMDKKDCDFWGMTQNNFGISENDIHKVVKRLHVQSYFIVLKKQIFLNNLFINFIKEVKKEEYKNLIISKYEIGLTEFLLDNNYKFETYINSKKYEHISNVTLSKWRQLILKDNMPFVKCSILRLLNQDITTDYKWEEFLSKNSNYPIGMIEKNLLRTKLKGKTLKIIPKNLSIPYYDMINNMPRILKNVFIKINRFLVQI